MFIYDTDEYGNGWVPLYNVGKRQNFFGEATLSTLN